MQPYLHYWQNDQVLHDMQRAAASQARIAELQLDHIDDSLQGCPPGDERNRLLREHRLLRRRAASFTSQWERIEEEFHWREDPGGLVEIYDRAGYRLVYLCGHHEFATHEQALDHARYLHQVNEVMSETGPDGSYVDDMLPPDQMVQAAFTLKGE